MDLIRATREISHYLLIIGISMILGGGLSLILMYLFPTSLSNPTQTIIFTVYIIFIGIVATLMGGGIRSFLLVGRTQRAESNPTIRIRAGC